MIIRVVHQATGAKAYDPLVVYADYVPEPLVIILSVPSDKTSRRRL